MKQVAFSLRNMKMYANIINSKTDYNMKSKEICWRNDFMTLVDVNIKVPMEMAVYLKPSNQVVELERNALLLYPYILKQTISHGRAAEILGIRKNELIDIYDKLGYSYLDMTMDELDAELEVYHKIKAKGEMI